MNKIIIMNDSDSLLAEWMKKNNIRPKKSKDRTAIEVEKFLKELELLTRPQPNFKKKKKKVKDSGGGSRKNYTFATSRKQQCIIKCNYVLDSVKKHKAFLRTYMPQKNKDYVKDKPVLFNATEDKVSAETIMDYETRIIDKMFFRFIISPKRQDVPLKILVRLFIKTVEKMTGYQLYWFAAEHHDTLHQHSHVLINGKDKYGRDVHFAKAFFRSEFREILQNICTEMLGMRTDREIELDKEERLRFEWWTRLDRDIKNYSTRLVGCIDDYPFSITSRNSNMHTRLLFLVEKGLAKKVGTGEYPGQFLLSKDWEEKLRETSKYRSYENFRNDYLLRENVDVLMYKFEEVGPIKGKVIQVIRQDIEYERDNAIIIEDTEHRIWYVPPRKEPSERLQPGCPINFGVKDTPTPAKALQKTAKTKGDPDYSPGR